MNNVRNPEKPLLTIAVIAKNEADRMPHLLRSAKIADEILIVDSGSTDGTVDICESFGARVIHQDWMGYAAQKQFAMEAAAGEWILSLDADEALSEEGAAEILKAIRDAPRDVNGFSLPRLSRYSTAGYGTAAGIPTGRYAWFAGVTAVGSVTTARETGSCRPGGETPAPPPALRV